MIGAHLSKTDIENSFDSIGAEVAQVFLSNPRGYQAPNLNMLDICKIIPIYAHLPYLVNFASSREDVVSKSMVLYKETDRIYGKSIKGIIVHGGQGGLDSNIAQTFSRWEGALNNYTSSTTLLIENTAGGNAAPGKNIDDLITLVKKIRYLGVNVGVCLDTCHLFAAGYNDMSEVYRKVKGELGRVDLIHLNDSKDKLSSSRDRHANINEGEIKIKILKPIILDAIEDDVDMILETPGGLEVWREEIKLVKNLS